MTHSKTPIPLVALVTAAILAAACLTGCGADTGAVGTADRTFTVDGPVRLELQNGSGDSRVVVGAPGEVRIHAEFHVREWLWGNPDQTLKDLVANPPFSQDGNLIRVGGSRWDMDMVSVEYSITVPSDTEMRGTSGSGNLDVSGIAGPATFITGSGNIVATAITSDMHALVGSGDVTFTDTQGRVDVIAGSGNIVVHGGKGEVRARTGSGDVRIEHPGANVVAEAGSGNVEVRDAAGDVRLHTGSGDITLDGDPAPSSYWDIRASSGDVRLHVPSSASFRFYARSSSGDFDVAVPSAAEQSQGKHEYQARIGDGKARVEIVTSSGDVSLH
jgi:putative adhesin